MCISCPSCWRWAFTFARSSAASAARFAVSFEGPDADWEDATDTAIAVAAAAMPMGQPEVPCGVSHRSVWLCSAVFFVKRYRLIPSGCSVGGGSPTRFRLAGTAFVEFVGAGTLTLWAARFADTRHCSLSTASAARVFCTISGMSTCQEVM